jgi:hypothetical protein
MKLETVVWFNSILLILIIIYLLFQKQKEGFLVEPSLFRGPKWIAGWGNYQFNQWDQTPTKFDAIYLITVCFRGDHHRGVKVRVNDQDFYMEARDPWNWCIWQTCSFPVPRGQKIDVRAFRSDKPGDVWIRRVDIGGDN